MLRCWALVCAWAGTGVPDGRVAGRADGCLRACHASPNPGSRESRWNSSRRCRLLCVASGWVSRCEAVGEMAQDLLHAGELLAATICASLRAARGPRICGASGARPRSRFTVDLSGGRPPHSKTRLTCASQGHRLRPVKCVFVCVSPHRCSPASVCPASVARQATLFADGLPARATTDLCSVFSIQ